MITKEDLKELDAFLVKQQEAEKSRHGKNNEGPQEGWQEEVIRRCQKIEDSLKATEDTLRAAMEEVQQTPEEVKSQTECVDQVLATIKERGRIYGDPALSHHNIGLTWTGLIQQHYGIRLDHPLPAWLVELMMVAFKVHRSARVFHQDNYVDAKAYLKFAEEDQEKGVV